MEKEGREISRKEQHDISKTVRLYEERGETDRIITAVIEDEGIFVFLVMIWEKIPSNGLQRVTMSSGLLLKLMRRIASCLS